MRWLKTWLRQRWFRKTLATARPMRQHLKRLAALEIEYLAAETHRDARIAMGRLIQEKCKAL